MRPQTKFSIENQIRRSKRFLNSATRLTEFVWVSEPLGLVLIKHAISVHVPLKWLQSAARAYTIEPDCMSSHCSSCFRQEVVWSFMQRVDRNSILLEFSTKVSRGYTRNLLQLTQNLGGRKWPQWLSSIYLTCLRTQFTWLEKAKFLETVFCSNTIRELLTIERKFVQT